MRINWKNIYGFLGVILCIYVCCKTKHVAVAYLESLADNREYLNAHPAMPFLVFALLCVTAIAISKILSQRKK